MRTPEPAEILHEFTRLLAGPTTDGQKKRVTRNKPNWKVDPDHYEAMYRHLQNYEMGETEDVDSGSHPLVHVAWRALALAYQETQVSPKISGGVK